MAKRNSETAPSPTVAPEEDTQKTQVSAAAKPAAPVFVAPAAAEPAIPDFLLHPKRGDATMGDSATDSAVDANAASESVATPSSPTVATTSASASHVQASAPVKEDVQAEEGERQLPPASILRHNPHSANAAATDKELAQTTESLQSTLQEFNLHSRVVGWISGPTVTTFKVQPGEGERVSRISNLEDDIALSLAAQSVRIFAPIPGTSLVGIEIPNRKRQNVNLGDVLPYAKGGPLELAIGRDAEGAPIVADLAKMPHLLIAGTTGSGKSVMINSIVVTLLMRTMPEDVRLIMVDPKVVELNVYNGIPHLLTPVITEPKRVLKMLNWLVEEMERRFRVFGQCGARNIEGFNSRIREFGYATEKMPYIVLIMDEFADLMTVIGKDIEDYIRRLMAKARAAGIHVVMATQRPSAEVVTGTIKNNIPTRIAFAASSVVNSRIILDEAGAENLLGKGDMLLSTQSTSGLTRIQGAFLSDEEVDKIVSFVKTQGEPDYLDEAIFEDEPEPESCDFPEDDEGSDADLYEKAKQICFERKGASASYLQRRLSIGYNRAARLVEQMEDEGIVGPANGSKPREILRYE